MATKTTTKKKAAPKKASPKKENIAGALEAAIFDTNGKSAGTIALPADMFGLDWNADLVHQVVTSMQANARHPIAHTKDRSEVRGGGRKPWKQKGTGRARHGSSRSPIWVGGGVAHGPRNDKSYEKKVNRSMRRKALFVTLSRKFRDGEVFFVSDFAFNEPKTAKAKEALAGLSKVKGLERLSDKKVNAALIALPAMNKVIQKSFNNFGNIAVESILNINPVEILTSKYLIIANPKEALETLKVRSVTNK